MPGMASHRSASSARTGVGNGGGAGGLGGACGATGGAGTAVGVANGSGCARRPGNAPQTVATVPTTPRIMLTTLATSLAAPRPCCAEYRKYATPVTPNR